MGKILKIDDLKKSQNINLNGKKLVLVGGCFDILHVGHIEFLKQAKAAGDLLAVMLEDDLRIKNLKGAGRPINSQADRSVILANLPFVDYVIPLKNMKSDKDYEILVKWLKPDIIAVTAGNTIFDWEKDLVNTTGTKVVEVLERIEDYSTSKIVNKTKL